MHRYFGPHVLLGDEVATATINTSKPCSLRATGGARRLTGLLCLPRNPMVCDLYLAANYAQTIGLEDALTASLMLNALLLLARCWD